MIEIEKQGNADYEFIQKLHRLCIVSILIKPWSNPDERGALFNATQSITMPNGQTQTITHNHKTLGQLLDTAEKIKLALLDMAKENESCLN